MQSLHRRLGLGMWCIVLNTDLRDVSLITGSHPNTQSVSHTTYPAPSVPWSRTLSLPSAASIPRPSSFVRKVQDPERVAARLHIPHRFHRPPQSKPELVWSELQVACPRARDFRKRWPRTLRITSCVSPRTFFVSPTIFSHLCFRSGGGVAGVLRPSNSPVASLGSLTIEGPARCELTAISGAPDSSGPFG